MSSSLDNLVRIGKLKGESPAQSELDGLIHSGKARLADAGNESLSLDSRFDLAYNAAHALSLAALRWHGYRSGVTESSGQESSSGDENRTQLCPYRPRGGPPRGQRARPPAPHGTLEDRETAAAIPLRL